MFNCGPHHFPLYQIPELEFENILLLQLDIEPYLFKIIAVTLHNDGFYNVFVSYINFGNRVLYLSIRYPKKCLIKSLHNQ